MFFAFSFIGLLLLLLLLASLLSTGFLFALWMSCLDASSLPVGVREESRCCDLSDGFGGPKRRRSHRNAVWVQRVNSMRPVERTGCTVAAWSKGDGARRPACVQRPRRTCSSPACRLWLRDEGPTAVELSLDHVVAGCGALINLVINYWG